MLERVQPQQTKKFKGNLKQ
jgi:hypothetical protein